MMLESLPESRKRRKNKKNKRRQKQGKNKEKQEEAIASSCLHVATGLINDDIVYFVFS